MRFVHFRASDGALYVLAHEPDVRRLDPETHERVTGEAARILQTADERQRREVIEWWGQLHPGELVQTGPSIDDELAQIVAELDRPVSDLALLRVVRPRPPLSYEPVTADTPLLSELGEAIQSDSWVGFTLLDLEGEPLADVRYELTLPDGSTQSGATDGSGQARHDGVARGSCSVTFPDLDESYWELGEAGG